METIKENKKNIDKAVCALKKGAVLVFPTDTIYGFIADATNKKSVEKIYRIKGRPKSNPLPIFVKDIKMAKELALIDKKQEKILNKKWPGKYTFILNRKKAARLYGVDQNTIALRLPKYKFLNDLLNKINKPLVQTSVNISGQSSIIKIKEIVDTFANRKNQPDLIIDAGDMKKNKSSKIIDLTGSKIKILRN